MNFYLDGLETIIYNIDPDGIRPIRYSFINVEMEGDLLLTPASSEKRHWITNAVYGEIVYVNHSPDAL